MESVFLLVLGLCSGSRHLDSRLTLLVVTSESRSVRQSLSLSSETDSDTAALRDTSLEYSYGTRLGHSERYPELSLPFQGLRSCRALYIHDI